MDFTQISDKNLLCRTMELVKKEKACTIEVLKHLLEIDRRRLFADIGYSSLFSYSVQHLKYSPNEAQVRIAAMRLMKDAPQVEKVISSGDLSLTNANLAYTHMKQENLSFDAEVKEKVVTPLVNKPTRQAEQILNSMKKNPNERKIRIEVSEGLYEKFEEYRKLKGHHTDQEIINDILSREIERIKEDRTNESVQIQNDSKKVTLSKNRYIPHAIKRKALVRSNYQCENVSPDGKRCDERRFLEFDHIVPFSMGAHSDLKNIRVLCKCHNQRAAIKAFGIKKMDRYINKY